MKKRFLHIIPWLITCVAFYFAFSGVDWRVLLTHVGGANFGWLLCATLLTCCSYLFRARRWQFLFPEQMITLVDSIKVLILGFFMNNILPARAGELVRAHMGSKVTYQTRTLVLATIASERLADGLMLSVMFVAFAFGLGDQHLSESLFYVAILFGVVTALIVLTIALREKLFGVAARLQNKLNSKTSAYTLNRLQVFINGLLPLCTGSKLPIIILWTAVVWSTELVVYMTVVQAYGASLSLPYCVLFLVAVNFSSLIPAAPGGFGVIEAIASAVLVSIGIEKELALSMVFTQHMLQYFVVGAPGVVIMFSWQSNIKQYREAPDECET
ncbi:flippase-like domain-containing protein [Oligoflexia bacterium]|nr:flippase-like domain-containing protein [Oligoflexia bacterium]